MTGAANEPLYRPSGDRDVIVLRLDDPCLHGLRESYHDLRRALSRVEKFCDPASREQARRLRRARLIVLDALVERS